MRSVWAALIGVVAAVALAGCTQKVGAVSGEEMSLGDANAKVTVIEYASVACPVCASWNNTNFAGFKTKYIDTKRVHYVMREALTHDPMIAAAGFMVARCAGKDKYFKVVDEIYHARDAIEASPAPRDNLLAIGKANGLTDEQFQACVGNEKALSDIRARWEKYATVDKINSTPTFVVNGKIHVGDISMAELDQAITEAEKAPKP